MEPLTITDNYILITSDEEILRDDHFLCDGEFVMMKKDGFLEGKKIIGHLPIKENIPTLQGVPLLPPLPSGEDDVEKMAEQHQKGGYDWQNEKRKSFKEGYNKAREKYRFTEENMRKAIEMSKDIKYVTYSLDEIIQSISQPKMPIGFKCEMGTKYFEDSRWETHPIIVINQEGQNVMLGEWIY